MITASTNTVRAATTFMSMSTSTKKKNTCMEQDARMVTTMSMSTKKKNTCMDQDARMVTTMGMSMGTADAVTIITTNITMKK